MRTVARGLCCDWASRELWNVCNRSIELQFVLTFVLQVKYSRADDDVGGGGEEFSQNLSRHSSAPFTHSFATGTAKPIPAYQKIREFASYICEDTVVEGAGRGFSLQTRKRPLVHVVQVLGVAIQGVQRWYCDRTWY